MKVSSLAPDAPDNIAQLQTTFLVQGPVDHNTTGLEAHHKGELGRDSGDQSLETADISRQKLEHVAEAMDSYLSSLGVNLKFQIDERTEKIQVEVREPKTDKLIRKIPADEMLELAASIEHMAGLFLDKTL